MGCRFNSSTVFAAEKDPEVHLQQLKRFSLRELQVATDTLGDLVMFIRDA